MTQPCREQQQLTTAQQQTDAHEQQAAAPGGRGPMCVDVCVCVCEQGVMKGDKHTCRAAAISRLVGAQSAYSLFGLRHADWPCKEHPHTPYPHLTPFASQRVAQTPPSLCMDGASACSGSMHAHPPPPKPHPPQHNAQTNTNTDSAHANRPLLHPRPITLCLH